MKCLFCRAKAGGRQSAKDAGGKTIHSAGSALRRANEVCVDMGHSLLYCAMIPFHLHQPLIASISHVNHIVMVTILSRAALHGSTEPQSRFICI